MPISSLRPTLEIAKLDRSFDPFVDEIAKLLVVIELRLDLRKVRLSDEACGAFPLSCPAQLVIRSVLLRRSFLAAAARVAADVVLLAQPSWTQVAELQQLALDAFDAALKKGDSRFHSAHTTSRCR